MNNSNNMQSLDIFGNGGMQKSQPLNNNGQNPNFFANNKNNNNPNSNGFFSSNNISRNNNMNNQFNSNNNNMNSQQNNMSSNAVRNSLISTLKQNNLGFPDNNEWPNDTIDCIEFINDNTIATCSYDGCFRIYQIQEKNMISRNQLHLQQVLIHQFGSPLIAFKMINEYALILTNQPSLIILDYQSKQSKETQYPYLLHSIYQMIEPNHPQQNNQMNNYYNRINDQTRQNYEQIVIVVGYTNRIQLLQYKQDQSVYIEIQKEVQCSCYLFPYLVVSYYDKVWIIDIQKYINQQSNSMMNSNCVYGPCNTMDNTTICTMDIQIVQQSQSQSLYGYRSNINNSDDPEYRLICGTVDSKVGIFRFNSRKLNNQPPQLDLEIKFKAHAIQTSKSGIPVGSNNYYSNPKSMGSTIIQLCQINSIVSNPVKQQYIATGGSDGNVNYYNLDNRNNKNINDLGISTINCLQISKDGNYLAISGGYDWSMGFYGRKQGQEQSYIAVQRIKDLMNK